MTRIALQICSAAALLAVVQGASAAPPVYAVQNQFAIGGEGGWDYMSVDSANHHLFISRGTQVQVMDTETGKLAGTIANTPGVHGIAIASKYGKGFTSNGRDNTVTAFDLRSLKELTRIPTTGQGPDCIIYDSGTGRVFTMNGRSRNSTAIDAGTNAVVGTVALDGRPEYGAADGRGHVYVNIEDKSEIQEIDSRELKVLRTWSLAPGEGPSGLAIDPRGGYLFSTCDGVMVVSDIRQGKVVATPKIGDGPDAAAFDGRRGLAFASCGQGVLSIIQEGPGGSFKNVQDLQTLPSARTMALDARTHKIYLIAAKMEPPAPGQRRGRIIPGSTTILVVGSQ